MVLRACRWLEQALTRVELGAALLAFAAMLALSVADIIGRNLFNATLPGGDLVLRQLVLWIALPGAALAVAAQRHLHLDPANLAARPRWRKLTAIPFNLAAAFVCALLTHAAWAYWQDARQYQSADAVWLVWLGLILPIAFGLLVLHFLLRAVLENQETAA
ncbi:MAG: TRAP transporter small permease [Thiobacillus sp.]|uniref:TRAP transporter small permease n=1 Tax=Thiobacillus sp. TaxID=924 RepID=UPI002732A49A|nr:TRAP transporter small permease [Thiobacillus sp.]MDP3420687.1 TRAP transporter small permease [Thiobacillus sp.]MDP3586379.1 TRAP transporter small permease [Thiobacillus sp.]